MSRRDHRCRYKTKNRSRATFENLQKNSNFVNGMMVFRSSRKHSLALSFTSAVALLMIPLVSSEWMHHAQARTVLRSRLCFTGSSVVSAAPRDRRTAKSSLRGPGKIDAWGIQSRNQATRMCMGNEEQDGTKETAFCKTRMEETKQMLDATFGAVDDFSKDALSRRGLTDKHWEWRDGLYEEYASAKPFHKTMLAALPDSWIKEKLEEKLYVLDPETLTYGEFPLDFFVRLVSAAEPKQGDVFCDIGSGCGRLVFAASILWSDQLSCARGIEISPELHVAACAANERVQAGKVQGGGVPVEFELRDIFARPEVLQSVDIGFCYSTRLHAPGGYLVELSETYRKNLRPGTRVITIDHKLTNDGPWELIHSEEGTNRECGGTSKGFVWRVV